MSGQRQLLCTLHMRRQIAVHCRVFFACPCAPNPADKIYALHDKLKLCRLQIKNLPMAKFLFADGKIFICRWQNLNLPFIRNEFCRRPARHLPSANFYFADGKQKICNRQVRRWPSAKLYFLSGKFLFFKWEICQPTAKRVVFHDRSLLSLKLPGLGHCAKPA